MQANDKKIVILGGGITGLVLAERLSRKFGEQVILLEKDFSCGGLAATLSNNGLCFDLGSHRLHIRSSRQVIRYIENILSDSLLYRRRHGKLYFQGKFIKYPPNIWNLLKVYSTHDIFISASRYFMNLILPKTIGEQNFQTAMIRAVGWDIYNKVYRGYAEKLWGIDPKHISVDGMHKRKTVIDLKTLRNAFAQKHYFLYPKQGIGQISKKLEDAILRNRGKIVKGALASRITKDKGQLLIRYSLTEQGENYILANKVISTLPIDELYGLVNPSFDKMCMLRWRDVRLAYLHIAEDINDPTETYYFPSQDIVVGRVSEIKKYSPHINSGIKGTLITIEIPVSKGDDIWMMSEEALKALCMENLIRIGILDKNVDVLRFFSLKLDKVYPIYEIGWREKFQKLYQGIEHIPNLFTIGRGGLFLHCNIDHCVLQGIKLAEYILKSNNDKVAWDNQVKEFLTFSARD